MSYTAHFKRVSDGKISKEHYDFEWHEDGSDYWWSEGNMSCDCNRELSFERGLGNEPEPDDMKCGEGRYKVKILSDDGKILYNEWGD